MSTKRPECDPLVMFYRVREAMRGMLPDLALDDECEDTRYAIVFDHCEGIVCDTYPELSWPAIRELANRVTKELC